MPRLLLLVLVALSMAASTVDAFGRRTPVPPTRTTARFGSTNSDTVQRAKGLFKSLRPILGYYAVMLAPIYGVGLAPFLGEMTDFQTLTNECGSREPNYSLCHERIVAPPNFTPARAQLAKVYDVSVDDLEKIADTVIKRQPRVTEVGVDALTHRREYVQRSLIFRFPDTVTFQFIPVEGSPTKSTLASHSRSIYGASDLGVNKARLNDWLAAIDAEVAARRD